jgi:hypothetical protein
VAQAHSFFPENNLWIPEDAKSVSSMDEATFKKILEKFKTVYGPIVTAKGGTFTLDGDWSDGTVNARTTRYGDEWVVQISGGLGRYPNMTLDAFSMIICHELGHQFGGAPLYDQDWASNEGQADYYGSLKCLRKIFADEDNKAIVATLSVPALVTEKCSTQYSKPEEITLCKRISMTALANAKVLADVTNTPVPDFSTPDTNVVTVTQQSHPDTQCRLDTMFQGALCPVDHNVETSNTDPFVGTCKEGLGSRPLCWFNPTSL